MKPTRLHYFYAYKLPAWLWIILVPLLCVALMASALDPPSSLSPIASNGKSYLFLLGLAWLLGCAGGSLVGTFILGPIQFHRARLNGAPYQPGDLVEILVGPYRGCIVRVQESLDGRGTVKVDLGEQTSPIGKSIFWSGEYFEETQLLKVGDAEQPLAGGAPQAARP